MKAFFHAGAAEGIFSRISRRTGRGACPPSPSSRAGRRAPGLRRPRRLSSTRQSRGLEEFFAQIRDTSGLTILDLGGATQKNISFITDLGHRLYSEDFLRSLNEAFGGEDRRTRPTPDASITS